MARGGDFTTTLPSFTTLVIHLAVFDVVDEVWSYYVHRILHLRYVYKYVHKIHHEWKNPISISSDYAHPLDHLHTVIPLVLGPLLMGSSPVILWVWSGLVTFTAIIHHSGYHLPFLSSPRFHFYHHQKPLECYGTMGLLDYLHGTDHKYRRSHHYPIDTTYYSLTPLVPPKQH
ncbi:hypothetical protein Pmani_007657 [Petrolisthes manimaculis]|uniref:Fatty acid hydroxylase domain-containing protein n=1 Tax=Petrolisthes manimaculis TaxID=1843537 RepID=A0AAE1Q8H7_9EUCA|nr:hypothetical protein Pmani_007657 [Petrolisthes manimaculis]